MIYVYMYDIREDADFGGDMPIVEYLNAWTVLVI